MKQLVRTSPSFGALSSRWLVALVLSACTEVETEAPGGAGGTTTSSGASTSAGAANEGGAMGGRSAGGQGPGGQASGGAATGGSGEGGAVAASCQGLEPLIGDTDYELDFDGDTRTFRVHAAPAYDPSLATPIVFVLHGYLETGDQIETISKMTPEIDGRGWLVVYPDGRSFSWNAGGCCGSSSALDVDDVGFFRAMLETIGQSYCIDPARVFVGGFSNGGMLSHRLACEASDVVAAIAPVSGTMSIDPCTPARAVPVMEFHGTADFVVPFDGGGLGNSQSVPDTIAGWVERDGCASPPEVTYDQGDATCETYGACNAGAEVTLCTLTDGGHQWPGGESAGPGGTINMDISASAAMLDFFAQHPLP